MTAPSEHQDRQPLRFAPHERRILLAAPRLGPQFVERLEQAGFNSLEHLCRVGAQQAVAQACLALRCTSPMNRARALDRALRQCSDAQYKVAC